MPVNHFKFFIFHSFNNYGQNEDFIFSRFIAYF